MTDSSDLSGIKFSPEEFRSYLTSILAEEPDDDGTWQIELDAIARVFEAYKNVVHSCIWDVGGQACCKASVRKVRVRFLREVETTQQGMSTTLFARYVHLPLCQMHSDAYNYQAEVIRQQQKEKGLIK